MLREEIPNAIRKHGQRIKVLEEALRVYEARFDAVAVCIDQMQATLNAQAVTIDEQRKLLDCAAEAVFAVADAGKAAEKRIDELTLIVAGLTVMPGREPMVRYDVV